MKRMMAAVYVVAGIIIGLMIGAYIHDRHIQSYLQKIKELKEYNFQKDRDLDACLVVLEDDEIGLYILGDDCVCGNGDK